MKSFTIFLEVIMEPVFTLPYSEFVIVEELAKYFKKNDGYSVFVPTSRQQIGIDLLLVKQMPGETETLSIQVKSSRVWQSEKVTKYEKENQLNPVFGMWFKKFDYNSDYSADFNFFIGFKPSNPCDTSKSKSNVWIPEIIVMSRSDLREIFDKIEGWNIYFTWYDDGTVRLTRGLDKPEDISRFKFTDMIPEIQKAINRI